MEQSSDELYNHGWDDQNMCFFHFDDFDESPDW